MLIPIYVATEDCLEGLEVTCFKRIYQLDKLILPSELVGFIVVLLLLCVGHPLIML